MANDEQDKQMSLLKQGAEAKVYVGDFFGKPTIIKQRFTKRYRHPVLDKSLTNQRTKSEVRAVIKCRMNGIQTPAIYFVDHEKSCIYMEYIENCITVRDFITNILKTQRSNYMELLRPLVETIGTTLSKMHEKNIIHGDLTTSNMLLRNDPNELDLVLIDFGLGYVENLAEDKGVDLYVLERAFLSTHPNTEKLFEILIKSYANYNKNTTAEVISKLDEVRMRGRKRTMVG